ncbi:MULTISPECIES: hypothetical protein [unclassified Colwellia]|nr:MULTISPECIES: hypothetical protein [unclassified Colwellia]
MRLKETIDNDHQILGMYLGGDLFDKWSFVRLKLSHQTTLD